MPVEQATTFRLTIVRKFVLAAIVVFFLGVQIGFPLISFSLGRNGLIFTNRLAINDSPLRQRLQFQGLLHPHSLLPPLGQFASCAVDTNAVYLLLTPMKDPQTNDLPNELVQFDRQSGRVTTMTPPEGIRYVLSDAKTVWWLPGDESITVPNLRLKDPFLLDGRPVAIKLDSSQRSPCLHQLVEFVDGRWREEDRFALTPCIFEPRFMIQSDVVQHVDHFAFVIRFSGSDFFYRRDLETGTRFQATLFADRYGFPTTDHLRNSGWTQIHFDDGDEVATRFSPRFRQTLGMWIEDEHPCAIVKTTRDPDPPGTYVSGFDVVRFFLKQKPTSTFAATPIQWGLSNAQGWIHVVAGGNGEAFIVSCNGDDGRLHLLRWNGRQLELVGCRGSPLAGWIWFDSASFGLLAFIIPMLLLALFAVVWQRAQGVPLHTCGMQTLIVSSAVRRGVARLIDASIPANLLLLPFIFQIDAIGWWLQMHRHIATATLNLEAFLNNPSWDSLDEFWAHVSIVFHHLLSNPVPWLLLIATLLFVVSQIAWQGFSGRTVGKWLLGLKVLRTTHRPSGFARSLLREILFVLESIFLLSWIPGVVSILATQRSQRIGDVLADTIVVRDLPLPRIHVEPTID